MEPAINRPFVDSSAALARLATKRDDNREEWSSVGILAGWKWIDVCLGIIIGSVVCSLGLCSAYYFTILPEG